MVGSVSHPHSFGVVGHGLRLLAVGALATNFSTLVSITGPAFSGPLPLRLYESGQCISVHPGTPELDSFFFVVVTVAPPGAEAVVHQSSVACGTNWCIYTSHFALGRLSGGERG